MTASCGGPLRSAAAKIPAALVKRSSPLDLFGSRPAVVIDGLSDELHDVKPIHGATGRPRVTALQNRASKKGEVAIVPCGAHEFGAERSLGGILLDAAHREGSVAWRGDHGGRVAAAAVCDELDLPQSA